MTPKQIKTLIAAGVFSTAFLSGSLYAADSSDTPPPAQGLTASTTTHTTVPDGQNAGAKSTTTQKDGAQHACAGAGGCGGK